MRSATSWKVWCSADRGTLSKSIYVTKSYCRRADCGAAGRCCARKMGGPFVMPSEAIKVLNCVVVGKERELEYMGGRV